MNKDFRTTLDARLSGMRWGEREQANVLRQIRQQEVQEVKHVKRGSAMMAFAMATLLLVMGTALAMSTLPTPMPTVAVQPQGDPRPAVTLDSSSLITATLTGGVYNETGVRLNLDMSLKEGLPYTLLRAYNPQSTASVGTLYYSIQLYLTVEQQEYPFTRSTHQFQAGSGQINGGHLQQEFTVSAPFLNETALVEADIRLYDRADSLVEQITASFYLHPEYATAVPAQPTPNAILGADELATLTPMPTAEPGIAATLAPDAAATPIPLGDVNLYDCSQQYGYEDFIVSVTEAELTGRVGEATVLFTPRQPDSYRLMVNGAAQPDNGKPTVQISASLYTTDHLGSTVLLEKWEDVQTRLPYGESVSVAFRTEKLTGESPVQPVCLKIAVYDEQTGTTDHNYLPLALRKLGVTEAEADAALLAESLFYGMTDFAYSEAMHIQVLKAQYTDTGAEMKIRFLPTDPENTYLTINGIDNGRDEAKTQIADTAQLFTASELGAAHQGAYVEYWAPQSVQLNLDGSIDMSWTIQLESDAIVMPICLQMSGKSEKSIPFGILRAGHTREEVLDALPEAPALTQMPQMAYVTPAPADSTSQNIAPTPVPVQTIVPQIIYQTPTPQ